MKVIKSINSVFVLHKMQFSKKIDMTWIGRYTESDLSNNLIEVHLVST